MLYFNWMNATASKRRIRGMFIEENARVEKRKAARAKFSDAINYQFRDTNDFGGCLAYDISEGGIKITFNDFVATNTEMILQMKLRHIPKIIDVSGRVVWAQRIPFSDRYHVGLQFTASDPISQGEIRSYVKSHQS